MEHETDSDDRQSEQISNVTRYVTDHCIITEGKGSVTVNGFIIYGYVLGDEHACKICGHMTVYDGEYDEILCPVCNVWPTHMTCSDPACDFCSIEKPEKPFPDFGVNDGTYPPRTGTNWLNIDGFICLNDEDDELKEGECDKGR